MKLKENKKITRTCSPLCHNEKNGKHWFSRVVRAKVMLESQ